MDDFFNTDEWLQSYNRLKTEAVEFTRLYKELENSNDIANIDPIFAQKRNKLLNRGDILFKTVEGIRNTANSIYGFADNLPFSLNGLTNPGNGLGLFWIPIAGIVAAIGAISLWVKDASSTLHEANLIRQLQNEGYSASAAIDKVREGETNIFGIFSGASDMYKMIPWLVGGGLLFVGLKRLKYL